jgi:uncharacterized RDD family membrane protein YckC
MMSTETGFTDQLNIETPEQVDLRFPIAGIGSRFLAVLTDTIIQIVAELVLLLLFVLVVSAAQRSALGQLSDTSAKWFVAGVFLFHFLLYWGYFSLFEAFWNGQTPGKRLLKVRVIKDSGRQITFFEALARNLLRIVDLQFGYLVGVICMLCNKQQKRLGDFVAGTIVVHERTEEQPAMTHNSRTFTASIYQQPIVAETLRRNESIHLAADAVGRLQTQDLNMIDAFLTRALDLEMKTREEMARKMADRIAAKMQISLPDGVNPERFLEAVAFDMRAGARR